jgi:hypothetical protein
MSNVNTNEVQNTVTSPEFTSIAARPQKVAELTAGPCEDKINEVAEIATTVIMQEIGNTVGATRDEIFDVQLVGLKAAVIKAIDADVKLDRSIQIPVYFDSMTKGLRVKVGRTVVSTSVLESNVDVPEHYKLTVMKLKAAGVKFVAVHRPAIEVSNTLAYDIEEIDGVDCIVGNASSGVVVEDIVRRGLIQLSEESYAVMKQLAGDLAYMYGELDDILLNHFMAQTKTALGK